MRRIAVVIGAERKTIRGWLRAGCAPQWRKPGRDSILDTFRGHLERRWSEGCRNAALLWRELLALGFSGRPSIIRQWAGRRRKAELRAPAPAKETRPPTTRQLSRLLISDGNLLAPTERAFIAQVLTQMPGLAASVEAAKRLSKVLRRDSAEALDEVLAHAAETDLSKFVLNLRYDVRAVQAALKLPWTTSPAEGQINRLKMLKRTMYGRAGFDLLRARVLFVP